MTPEELIVTEAIKGLIKIALNVASESGNSLLKRFRSNEDLSPNLRKPIREYIINIIDRYGYMKVLGMSEGILLQNILINVQLLPDVNSNHYRSILELEKKFKEDGNRNFQYNDKNAHDGIEIVNQNNFIIVLGPPGSGKSTFLKKIAFESLNYTSASKINQFIPVIIELKKVEKQITILNYITSEFSICGFPDSDGFVTNCLKKGKLLLIFDGLDEINEAYESDVISDIKDFIDKYSKCKYVISSRNLAYKGDFKRFKEVEIANFNNDQIKDFSKKWFNSNHQMELSGSFIGKLFSNEYMATKELAQTPLLLTLLCLVFSHQQDFPKNRATLYKDSIDVLLKEWNAEKRIYKNPIYSDMTLPFEEMLLSQIAFEYFKENVYFFNKGELSNKISALIKDNLNAPKFLDGNTILNAISLQQGILIERAKNIFTFSHLTFQEFFTARFIDDNNLLEEHISSYINDHRWREVFLLLSGMIKSGSDKILLAISNQIDQDLVMFPALSHFLERDEQQTLDLRLFHFILKLSYLNSNKFKTTTTITTKNTIAELSIENYLSIIIREFELEMSKDLIATYILDFRLEIDDHYNELLRILKLNKDKSNAIKNYCEILGENQFNKKLLIELLKKSSNTNNTDLTSTVIKNFLEKIVFLIMCKNSAVKVSRGTWVLIENKLF